MDYEDMSKARRQRFRPTSITLSPEQSAQLAIVARIDDVSMPEAARRIINEGLRARKADKDFQKRRRELLEHGL